MQIYKNLVVNNTLLESYPFTSERIIEAQLIDNPKLLSMPEIEAEPVYLDSQVPILNGRTDLGTDGRIDLLIEYTENYLCIVEIKNDVVNIRHLEQLESYLSQSDQIIEYVEKNYKNRSTLFNADQKPLVIGILAGPEFNYDLGKQLKNGYQKDKIPIGGIKINRFKDKNGNFYIISDTYFKGKGKDFTRYIFNGESYGKGRLVLAVIKEYVRNHKEITLSQLKEKFPYELNKHWDLVLGKTHQNAKSPRFYMKEEDTIRLNDGTEVVVCSQWGIDNIGFFLEYAKNELKFQIELKN